MWLALLVGALAGVGCSRAGLSELPEFGGPTDDDAGTGDGGTTPDGSSLPDVPLADVNVPDGTTVPDTITQPDGVIGRFEVDCFDRFDNDFNGLVDCEDPVCFEVCGPNPGFEFDCFNGFDDDGNGLIDCEDPVCFDQCGEPPPPQREFDCFNGFDDDGDGAIDCEDGDCARQCGEPSPGECLDDSSQEALGGGTPIELIDGCSRRCEDEGSLECYERCFERRGLSGGCTGCFSSFLICISEQCTEVCENGQDQECEECIYFGACAEQFVGCSGIALF